MKLEPVFFNSVTLDLARKEKQNREQQDPIEHAVPMRTTVAVQRKVMPCFSRSCSV